MLNLRKQASFSLLAKLTILIILLAVVSSYSNGRFVFVQAFNSKINIYPENYYTEQNERGLIWQNISNAFFQELSDTAEFERFNTSNSAYIMSSLAEADDVVDVKGIGNDNQEIIDDGSEISEAESFETDGTTSNENDFTPPDPAITENEDAAAENPQASEKEDQASAVDGAAAGEIPQTPGADVPAEAAAPAEAAPTDHPTEKAPAAEDPAPESTSRLCDFLPKVLTFFKSIKKLVNIDMKPVKAQAETAADGAEESYGPFRQGLIFNNFSVPAHYKKNILAGIKLRLSLAAMSDLAGDNLYFDYGFGEIWAPLGELDIGEERSNAQNNGYYAYELPADFGWENLDNLKIRVSYLSQPADDSDFDARVRVHLDALWLEADYHDSSADSGDVADDGLADEAESGSEYGLVLLEGKGIYLLNETPAFKYRFEKKRGLIGRIGAGLAGLFYDLYRDINIEIAYSHGNKGAFGEDVFRVKYLADGEFTVAPNPEKNLPPGKYELTITVYNNDETTVITKDFIWGVLAFNTDKAVYAPGEAAYLQLASLDDTGHTLCDSRLEVEITSPSLATTVLSVADGTVVKNPTCGADNVTDQPDYYAYFELSESGDYRVKLTNRDNGYSVATSFTAREDRPYIVERTGATRINPFRAGYGMRLKVTVSEDFSGSFKETVPASFRVGEMSAGGRFEGSDGTSRIIAWPVELKAGSSREFQYTYFAPKESPQFYLLGPLTAYAGERAVFNEVRQWQIAADDQQAYTADGTFTVPPGVESVTIKAWGAAGGGGGGGGAAGAIGGGGGGGGFSQGTIAVNSGDALSVLVGGGGSGGTDIGRVGQGGGGGGYSAVRRSGTTLIQAGGGGGGAGAADVAAEDGGGGGGGSGADGANGARGLDAACGSGIGDNGDGGTTSAGGAGGSGCNALADGESGSANQGGGGGNGPAAGGTGGGGAGGANGGGAGGQGQSGPGASNSDPGGGGGGGGQYGGGGGEAGDEEGAGGGAGGAGKTDGLSDVTTGTGSQGATGAGTGGAAANTGDADYAGTAGAGGAGGNNANGSAGSAGRVVIIYTVRHVVAATTGTQISELGFPSANNYVGGAFVLTEITSTSTITGITITETGTVDAQNDLSNVRLYYNLDTTAPYNCASESFSAGTARFGATSTSFSAANGTASFSGSVNISTTSAMCVYVVLDIGAGAAENETLLLEISDPENDITASGNVEPDTAVAIAGTTTLKPFSVTLSASGSQTAALDVDSQNNHIGGTFVITENISLRNVTGITITENGTVDAQNNLANIRLYYDLDTTTPHNCATESFSLSDARFGATSTSFSAANGTATFTDSVGISTTSTMCVYVVLDVGPGAYNGQTIEIEISDPPEDIAIASGLLEPATTVALSGTTVLTGPNIAGVARSQLKSDGLTAIANNDFTDENLINLYATGYDLTATSGTIISFYYEALDENGTFRTATSVPANPCPSGTAYASCGTKIWTVSANVFDDYLATGTTNITAMPDRGESVDPARGYKWQVLACNNSGVCSSWGSYNPVSPNFKVDTDPPEPPGNLTLATTTYTSITVNFGSSTSDANFSRYRIFYKQGPSGVLTTDNEHLDANLAYIDYNSAASTTISRLKPNTQHVINIWAYDLAGNKTAAAEIQATTPPAPPMRARSVHFFGGAYSSSNGLTGQNTNTDYTFNAFNFKLAETNAAIRSAYIVFDARIEAYADNAIDYSGYKLAFDACAEPCTASAFLGAGSVLAEDDSILAYDETESKQVRLLFDVTEEAQLAAYAGNGTEMESQIGYHVKSSGAYNSIAFAQAALVITYSYPESLIENITNTVIYPLESTVSGDRGTTRASTIDDCAKNSTCPLFDYRVDIPEFSASLSRYFRMEGVNDAHGADDVVVNVNIQGTNIDSATYIHEAANGGEQGFLPSLYFSDVSGFAPNTAQQLEYYLASPGAATYYLLGGEVFETYTANKSAAAKTRTVSFPVGVVTSGQSTVTASGTANVFFPENGDGAGVVTVKKAWFRVVGNNTENAARTITLSTKTGGNSQSTNSIYNMNASDMAVAPVYRIFHVIPAADYGELQSANASDPKAVTLFATLSNANLGGLSAELMITYTYTAETTGYLASLDLYGGQSIDAGNSQNSTASAAPAVFPEIDGTKTVRAAALLSSYALSAGNNTMPSAWFTLDADISTGTPACANVFYHRDDGINSFSEFFRNVTTAISTEDEGNYNVCLANTNASNATAGAKMNAIWRYTYSWDAPSPDFAQKDWRWYDNIDAIQPSSAKADENTAVSGVNIGDILRLRLNAGVFGSDVSTSTLSVKLQYGTGADCAAVSNWADVGGITGTQNWLGYNNPAPADGVALGAALLASSDKAQSYEEANPSAGNPRALNSGEYGEWDFVLYNRSASSTTDYCFRLVAGSGAAFYDYPAGSYPKLTTAASNTAPNVASSLGQFRGNDTVIANGAWINETTVKLKAAATDPNLNEVVMLYYQFIPATSTFLTATSAPADPCASGTAYNSCASRVWLASSTPGDYRTSPYIGTTTLTALPQNYSGYKWRVLSCDISGACSAWAQPGVSPNLRIDLTPPTPPGNLIFATSTPTSVTLDFGASTTEANFSRYRIYYKAIYDNVTESDTPHTDPSLLHQNYNGTSSTIVAGLSANTRYVFNIWAYDQAGNKATATAETIGTTTPSYNPPFGYTLSTTAQLKDGSGVVDWRISASDPDNDQTVRAKVMYQPGDTCDFSDATYYFPTIDPADENITATFGYPDVDNGHPYRIGTTTGWILTGPIQNFVYFDWLSKFDEPAANGVYCLGLVLNDLMFDQTATHTKTLILDNIAPTEPGYLVLAERNHDSVTFALGTTSADTNFKEYKIFYKQGTAGVSEGDTEFASSTSPGDPNLGMSDYKLATTTTISGLAANTEYVFNIWAYDTHGNRASSSWEITVKTNAMPANITAVNQLKSDYLTAIANNSWTDESSIVLNASAHDQDTADLVIFYYELITATGTFTSLTTPPADPCASGTLYLNCPGRIWAVATSSSELPSDWYSGDWLYRKKLTIDPAQVAADFSDFPLLATTTDNDLALKARADGHDIIFTAADGITLLAFEREYYNAMNGELAVWIKTNLASTTDTVLYMYYGNTAATTDMSTTTGVWDDAYRGVWHLGEDVVDESSQAGAHRDSTANGHHGDQYGNNEAAGYIRQGQEFDGIDDRIVIGDSTGLDLSDAVTVEFWFKGYTNIEPPALISSSSVFTAAGAHNFVVPPNVTDITVKAWGGGGGGGGGGVAGAVGGGGGGGGFAQGTMSATPGETLGVRVGGGGGGGADNGSGGQGGGGGGYSAVLRDVSFLIQTGGGAGGGGAANDAPEDGGGGGSGSGADGGNGARGLDAACGSGIGDNGDGGTTASGGAGGADCSARADGEAGSANQGGGGGNGGGGNGGGGTGGTYGGGGGGSHDVNGVNNDPGGGGGGGGQYGGGGGEAGRNEGAGGGGGGAGKTDGLAGVTTGTGTQGGTGSGAGGAAANTGDADYAGTAGAGGDGGDDANGSAGSAGRMVFNYSIYEGLPDVIVGKGSSYGISLDEDYNLYGRIDNNILATGTVTATWQHAVLAYDRNAGGTEELRLYINGVKVDADDYSDLITLNDDDFVIGEGFTGIIDEVRVSATARSAGWLATQYSNQKSVPSFLAIESEAAVTSYYESVLVIEMPDNPAYSSGYKWQVMACDDDGDCSSWDKFNLTTPNFKVDTTDPGPPGQLTEFSKGSNRVNLLFGEATDEANFTEYRIFYSTSTPVAESDYEHSDSNLADINYSGASYTTVYGLNPATAYYFNIWAYDVVGRKASSTVTMVITNPAVSTPGVLFYSQDDRAVYYRVWDGTEWSAERSSGDIMPAGFNIRQISAVRSDDGGKAGLLLKAWDGSSQRWYGAVYRAAADDFVDTDILGAEQTNGTNNHLITGCIAPLSGGEFFVIRNNNDNNGTLANFWNPVAGWTDEGAGPGSVSAVDVMNGCKLVRRPGTDNYVLVTFDDSSDIGTAYYKGEASYDNNGWTIWTEHSTQENDIENFSGDAYFDAGNNTRGAINYTGGNTNSYTYAKYFSCTDISIGYGGAVASPASAPDDWGNNFVHGEFSADPGGAGAAYFAGRDDDGELNVYRVNVSSSAISWATSTNGDNISASGLYSHANQSQKPFAVSFYKSGKALLTGNYAAANAPFYSVITTAGNSLSATTSVTGAAANNWTRVRLYNDPNEDELLAVWQNDNVDYAAVFWDGGADQFHGAGNQAWTELAVNTSAADPDYELTSYAYTKYNTAPTVPAGLGQYRQDGVTAIGNGTWTNENTVNLAASVADYDTSEIITLYVQLITNNDTFATSTARPAGACAPGVEWGDCLSNIWVMATSSLGDYSYTAFTATATISALNNSNLGYKWQVIACDDGDLCSNWKVYNTVTPNFYVDILPPTAPGPLVLAAKTSVSVTLNFSATTSEANFDRYRIFYASSTPVTEASSEHSDEDLLNINFNGTTNTVVAGLAPNTLYYFNIWAYDLAGNKASSTAVSTTTSDTYKISLVSYLFENDDGADVNSNTTAVGSDTALTGLEQGTRLLARFQIENTGGDAASGIVYKLQFENQTASSGQWFDVGAVTEIRHGPGLSGASGDPITGRKAADNPNVWTDGYYQENTNLSASSTISNGRFTELVYAIHTRYALLGNTYRLRLYNNTDDRVLDGYTSTSTLAVSATSSLRYSKNAVASLPPDSADLAYFLDPQGYAAVAANDDINRDYLTAAGNYPVFNFALKNSTTSDAITATWNGSTTAAASAYPVYLQVFRFGSTNAWQTVASGTTAAANTDFTLNGNVNSLINEYYDGSYLTYWRVYQAAGSQTLSTDYINIATSTPVPEVRQTHYRWRNDDGSESGANWLEAEDTGSPTLGPEIGKGSTTRLRIAAANYGGGVAENYAYRLEYASSSDGCVNHFGIWTSVPAAAGEHFEMATSSYFADGDPTSARLSADGLTFVAGDMVEDPSNQSDVINLNEGRYTENEYAILVTDDAQDAGTYCFRVTNGGAALDAYVRYPVVTLSGNLNSAPAFSVFPSDNGSASSSPTNSGEEVSFTATAADADGDPYYLAVCQTNSVSPGNNAAPACNGGEWCVSGETTSGNQASCIYETATSTEVNEWWAFVCDKVTGFNLAKCSAASQGSGSAVNDSPFVINHPPDFTLASTTDNYNDPGENFTVTAFATDNNTASSADTLRLYVCSTASADFQTGCEEETLCQNPSDASPDISCSFSAPLPAAAGDFTYYAFVYDSHGLAAAPAYRSATYTINNAATVLGTLILNNNDDITLGILGAPDTAISAVNASVFDLNGCESIVSAVGTIYMSGVSGGYGCASSTNDCYPIEHSGCVISDCASSTDMTAVITCTANLKYFAVPTKDDAEGNPWEEYHWMSFMRVFDGSNYEYATSSGVELNTNIALAVAEDEIDFGGNITAGQNTGAVNSTSTVINAGNSPIGTNVAGTDLSGDPTGLIQVQNIKWEESNFHYEISTSFLTSSYEPTDLVIRRATTTSQTSDRVYWGIGIPIFADSAVYYGRNSFEAFLKQSSW